MKLRGYQEDQLDFLNQHKGIGEELFDTNIALQSPTGSGKSYVMLQFVKDYFSENKNKHIVISTGFNNLVDQLYNSAKQFGIRTIILKGRNHCACTEKIESSSENVDTNYNPWNAFSCPKKYKANTNDCVRCSYFKSNKCIYHQIINLIKGNGNLLIITNHSSLLAHRQLFQDYTIGGFIDECQSFGDFYASHLRIEVKAYELYRMVNKLLDDKLYQNDFWPMVCKKAITSGKLTKEMIGRLLNSEISETSRSGTRLRIKDVFTSEYKRLSEALTIVPDDDNFIHPQIENGERIGVLIDRFFMNVALEHNYCLVSATVDKYTRTIFNGVPDNNFYNERNYSLTDYKRSALFIYKEFEKPYIKHFLEEQTGDRGLVLTTRIDLINYFKEEFDGFGYEIVEKVSDLKDGKKQILIGSKSLFQGVDIQNINFIIINKVPFARYDQCYRKQMRYFQINGHNSFNFYTIPYTENQLVQCMGRLWRKPGDKGNIAIFDKKACQKHINIVKTAMNYRKGMPCFNQYEYQPGVFTKNKINI